MCSVDMVCVSVLVVDRVCGVGFSALCDVAGCVPCVCVSVNVLSFLVVCVVAGRV